jgi:hypothetical protein
MNKTIAELLDSLKKHGFEVSSITPKLTQQRTAKTIVALLKVSKT